MLFRLGTLFLTTQVDRARPLLEEALAGFRRIGNKMGECEAGGNLAELELMTGDAQLGRRLLEENIELAQEIGFTWWEAGKAHSLAEHLLMTGDLDEAGPWAARALELSRQGHDRSGCVYTLGCYAWAAAARGDAAGAGVVWGAIEAEEARGGPVGRGWEERARAQYEAVLAAVAGQEFEQGRAEGAKLGLDDAVENALGGRNKAPRCLVR